ncbi:hypothetical protein BSNK01_14620 [Bacillaceae bacterium]
MTNKEQIQTLLKVGLLLLLIQVFALIALRSAIAHTLLQLILGALIIFPVALFVTYRIKGQRSLAQRPPFIREAGWYRKPGEGTAAPERTDGEDNQGDAETGLEKEEPESDDEKEKAVALAKAKAAAAAKAKAARAAAAKNGDQSPEDAPAEETAKTADGDDT